MHSKKNNCLIISINKKIISFCNNNNCTFEGSKRNKNIMKNLVSAKIKTKSNYGNLNGKFYQVTEMVGTRVTCICEVDGRIVHVDFNLSEVLEFNYNN